MYWMELWSTWRNRGLFKGESQLAFSQMALYYLGDATIFQNLTLKLQVQKYKFVITIRLDLRSITYVHRTFVVNQNTNSFIAIEQYCLHMNYNSYTNMTKPIFPQKWRVLFGNPVIIMRLFWCDWFQNKEVK